MNAKTKTFCVAVVAAAAFCALPATGQERDPVLVWGVSAISDIPQDSVDRLSIALADVVGRTTGLNVASDDAADEGFDAALDNGECQENNMTCVIEVARAIGLSDAVSGDLGIVGNVYILTLRRINAATGTVAMQVTGQTDEGIDVLIRSLPDMVATLFDIPHNQTGMVMATRYEPDYRYVIVTYGRPFTWLEPSLYVGWYPWWWSGQVKYYHHHRHWWGWHHRHPQGRPHYHGPRRPYPTHYHHGSRHPHGGHDDGRRQDRHDADRDGGRDRDDGRGRDDRQIRVPQSRAVDRDRDIRPMPREQPRTDVPRLRPDAGRDRNIGPISPTPARPPRPQVYDGRQPGNSSRGAVDRPGPTVQQKAQPKPQQKPKPKGPDKVDKKASRRGVPGAVVPPVPRH